MNHLRSSISCLLAACFSLTACGGGGGGGGGASGPVLPTPTPIHGGLVVDPSYLSIDGTDTAAAQSFRASESDYTGAFSETDTCSPSGGAIVKILASPNGVFNLTGVRAGTCSVTVHDTNGESASVSVDVNTQSIVVQYKNRSTR